MVSIVESAILLILTLIPSVLVVIRMCKEGTSKKVRHMIVRRHLSYILLIVLFSLQVLNYQTDFKFNRMIGLDKRKHDPYIDLVFNCFGLFIFLQRVSEPFVFHHVKQDWLWLLRKLTCSTKEG